MSNKTVNTYTDGDGDGKIICPNCQTVFVREQEKEQEQQSNSGTTDVWKAQMRISTCTSWLPRCEEEWNMMGAQVCHSAYLQAKAGKSRQHITIFDSASERARACLQQTARHFPTVYAAKFDELWWRFQRSITEGASRRNQADLVAANRVQDIRKIELCTLDAMVDVWQRVNQKEKELPLIVGRGNVEASWAALSAYMGQRLYQIFSGLTEGQPVPMIQVRDLLSAEWQIRLRRSWEKAPTKTLKRLHDLCAELREIVANFRPEA